MVRSFPRRCRRTSDFSLSIIGDFSVDCKTFPAGENRRRFPLYSPAAFVANSRSTAEEGVRGPPLPGGPPGKPMGIHDGHRKRKREQFLRSGIDSFADHEALEVLLYYAIPRQDTNPLAHRLIECFGSLRGVLAATPEELASVDGVGMNAAVLLSLVGGIMRQAGRPRSKQGRLLDTTQRQGEYFRELFAREEKELIYLLCLDGEGRQLSLRRLSRGTSAAASADVRAIVESALWCDAVGVVLAHNHPSGIALPSDADLSATWLVQSALSQLGIRLVDHIIVAGDDFVSLRQSGQLTYYTT